MAAGPSRAEGRQPREHPLVGEDAKRQHAVGCVRASTQQQLGAKRLVGLELVAVRLRRAERPPRAGARFYVVVFFSARANARSTLRG